MYLKIYPFVTVLGQDRKVIDQHPYLIHSCLYTLNMEYILYSGWCICYFIIQHIVTMSKYGHSALNIRRVYSSLYPAIDVLLCVTAKNGSFSSFFSR